MLRTALFLASAFNVTAGLGLAGLYFRFAGAGGVPILVLAIAVTLFVQGAFTVGYLEGWWSQFGDRAIQLFVAGEAAAALVGTLGTIQGILYNLHPRNGDQEFGPLMAAMLLAAHAAVGLIHEARQQKPSARATG